MILIRFMTLLLIISLLVPMNVYAENPKKGDLATAIAEETSDRKTEDAALRVAIDAGEEVLETLLGETRFFRATPSVIGNDCVSLVGTVYVCTELDGSLTAACYDPNLCDPVADPNPNDCPEICEEQGGIVVIDQRETSCAQEFVSMVCMAPNEYAARPSCPEDTILQYNSDYLGWVCAPIAPPIAHVSTNIFDLIETVSLFERAQRKEGCACSGVFAPVCATDGITNATYTNKCEAACDTLDILYNAPCIGELP